jgi:hypothetical protein
MTNKDLEQLKDRLPRISTTEAKHVAEVVMPKIIDELLRMRRNTDALKP